MAKTIRHKLSAEYSIGILILIFVLTFFLSGRLFESHLLTSGSRANSYLGMFLVSLAVIIMILILWEELLFPVKVVENLNEVIFRNHRNKLKIQVLLYLTIPAIIGFLYAYYEVNLYFFIPWTIVCLGVPVAGKLVSGINNYHDFLRVTDELLEYKNNEKEGTINIKEIISIELMKDEDEILSKLKLSLKNGSEVTIDLDEMELEEFYISIEEYLVLHFQDLIKFRC